MATKNILKTIFKTKLLSIPYIKVKGDSMSPSFNNDDYIHIDSYDKYVIGDIILYNYMKEGFIVHRILEIIHDTYYCKGDNSFRLEKIEKEDIIGKVIFIKRDGKIFPPKEVDNEFIKMSLKVSSEFTLLGYNHQEVMKSKIYNEYKDLYL